MNRCFGCNILSPTTTTTTAALAFIAALLPAQNLRAARLSVLYSGGGSQKTYTRVFVTSTTYDGNLGGLAGADAKCQARADAASLGGTWKAILSTSTVDARNRMVYRRLPVYDTLGRIMWNPSAPVSDSGADGGSSYLTLGAPPFHSNSTSKDSLALPIRINESGADIGSVTAWTGTLWDGSKSGTYCSDWTSTSGSSQIGHTGSKNIYWISYTSGTCTTAYRLYCLEDE